MNRLRFITAAGGALLVPVVAPQIVTARNLVPNSDLHAGGYWIYRASVVRYERLALWAAGMMPCDIPGYCHLAGGYEARGHLHYRMHALGHVDLNTDCFDDPAERAAEIVRRRRENVDVVSEAEFIVFAHRDEDMAGNILPSYVDRFELFDDYGAVYQGATDPAKLPVGWEYDASGWLRVPGVPPDLVKIARRVVHPNEVRGPYRVA